jgi:hypothetical protein
MIRTSATRIFALRAAKCAISATLCLLLFACGGGGHPGISQSSLAGTWKADSATMDIGADHHVAYSIGNLPGEAFANCQKKGSGDWGFLAPIGNSSTYEVSKTATSGNDVEVSLADCQVEFLTISSNGGISLCVTQGGDECDSGIVFTKSSR